MAIPPNNELLGILATHFMKNRLLEFTGRVMKLAVLADSPTIVFISFACFLIIKEVGV